MPQQVGTLVKAMSLLDALAEAAPVGVMELSRRLKMDKSGVSRLLRTLKSHDFVRVDEDGRYDLGLRLFELGQVLQERLPFRKAIIPHVEAIARETGETAYAVHYHRGEIAYLYDRVSDQEIRLGARTGIRCPPWNHIAGKVILAQHDESSVHDDWRAAKAAGIKRLTAWKDFQRELLKIREQGYAVEKQDDKCLVAAPLLNAYAPSRASLMVGGPSFRMKTQQIDRIAKIVTNHAAKASRALGWMPRS